MTVEDGGRRRGAEIPEPDRRVKRGRSDHVRIGRHSAGRDPVTMPSQPLHALQRRQVPHLRPSSPRVACPRQLRGQLPSSIPGCHSIRQFAAACGKSFIMLLYFKIMEAAP